MNNELKDKLLDIFEVDELTEAQPLREIDTWDSLAGLSIIAMCDSDYHFTMTAAELKTINTVSDLATYIAEHAKK